MEHDDEKTISEHERVADESPTGGVHFGGGSVRAADLAGDAGDSAPERRRVPRRPPTNPARDPLARFRTLDDYAPRSTDQADDDEIESPFGPNPGRNLVRARSEQADVSSYVDSPHTSRPVTAEVRIDAVAAAVAAGIASERPHQSDFGATEVGESTGAFELPDWSDPPTGQVPRVLLDDPESAEAFLTESLLRGPSWREGGADWDNESDLSFLSHDEDDESEIAGRVEPVEDPFEFNFADVDVTPAVPDEELVTDGPYVPTERPQKVSATEVDGVAHRVRRHPRHAARSPRADQSAVTKRSPVIATITGLGIGVIALVCVLLGSVSTMLLVAVAVTAAAAEVFSSLRRAGFRPATLVGLVAVPALVIGAYLHGAVAVPVVLSLVMFFSAIWSLAGFTGDRPIINLGVTAFVICWTGVLGTFAALLLAPVAHPHRHGVAFVLGAVVLTVAHDVGSYAAGSLVGRHPIAPRVSPGKTVEGLAGGTILTLVVAAVIVARIHPFTMTAAVELGVLVALVAPVGDLLESVVKRDLGLKDMGKLLPAHGGVFDRIDAMLFVLPACYYLVRLHGFA